MQDGFLFNDEDPKKRGKGCDTLGTKKDGLKLSWNWGMYKKENKPGQVCFAKLGHFCLEAVFWHTDYEAQINYVSDMLVSYQKRKSDTCNPPTKKEPILVTRLQAQLKAEQLLINFFNDAKKLLIKKKLI